MSIKRFMHIFYLLGVKMASKIHTRSRGKILEEFKLVWKFLVMTVHCVLFVMHMR